MRGTGSTSPGGSGFGRAALGRSRSERGNASRSTATTIAARPATFPHLTLRSITSVMRPRASLAPRACKGGVAIVTRSMANLYDLMLLVDPAAPEERQSAVIREVQQLLSAAEIVGEHDWGTRRLAFEIDHREEADYRLWQFRAEPDLLERLNTRLRILDGVLRFRIIRLKPDSPPPPQPRPDGPRPREDRERESEGRVAARAAADAPATD